MNFDFEISRDDCIEFSILSICMEKLTEKIVWCIYVKEVQGNKCTYKNSSSIFCSEKK